MSCRETKRGKLVQGLVRNKPGNLGVMEDHKMNTVPNEYKCSPAGGET